MLVPVLSLRDLPEAVTFLTQVLDFQLAAASPEVATFYAVLTRDQDELHLNLMSQHRGPGRASVIVTCDDVDALFTSFRARGLPAATRANSPVHGARSIRPGAHARSTSTIRAATRSYSSNAHECPASAHKHLKKMLFFKKMEARAGIEPACKDLQSSA
jgi:catechol 2,3-dioxygenase-like lactoylglutathione lyase family enzyme